MFRKPECQYRVVIRDNRWYVSAFHGNVMLGPTMDFSDESVPDWIRKDVALLSLVDPMSEIKTIGHRIGEPFWLNAKEGEQT
jgi:hypothetical protein